MTDIMIKTAKEEFLKRHFTSAYDWALLAKALDPFYDSVDKHAEVYRVHWAAAKKKTPSGEIDWYAVLDINDRLWVSNQMITHLYVQLAKKIDPEFHCSVATPGAYKLITTAYEILHETESRQDYHVRAGLPPTKWEGPPQFTIKFLTLQEANRDGYRQLEERQRKKPSEITVKKSSCSYKQRTEEQPEINIKKVSFSPNPHRQESQEVNVEKFSCASRRNREDGREIPVRMVSCAQKRRREEGPKVLLKEFKCAPKRHCQERSEVTVKKFSYAPERHRVGWTSRDFLH